ncbi:MAG: DUF177 domain-containing protein [Bacilli bacterium]
MIVDLTRLNNQIEEYVNIDFNYSFTKDQLIGTDLLELNNVSIKGEISRDNLDNYNLYLIIKGTMVLPCAITLEPVDYAFKTEINDDLLQILQENDELLEKIGNTLDIFPIVWENILLEMPMRVVSDNANIHLEGDGWKLITEKIEDHNAFSDLKN